MNDKPRSLGSREILDARRAQLREPHVVQLTAFVDKLSAETGARFPYFDPLDGGVDAEVLFLFETPGRQADKSGFVSRNNPDPSANNFFEFNRKARFKRERTISWNIVPWYIGSASKNGSVKPAECDKGIEQLERLLELLPKLRAVVFFGKTAQRSVIPIANLRLYKLYLAPHPSPQSVNLNAGNKEKIIAVLKEVATFLASPRGLPGHQMRNSAKGGARS